MLLHRLFLNLRCREVRRDLADPYQMHSTLCRAFSLENQKCPPTMFLWRLEPESGPDGSAKLLVQSRSEPDWPRIGIKGWLSEESVIGVDVIQKLGLSKLSINTRFRYRLRANPSITRQNKRLGLFKLEEQLSWLKRKGERHGFIVETCHVSDESLLHGIQHNGNTISVFSVLYDGFLNVSNPREFVDGVASGVGHARALGLGLLSIAPARGIDA